MRITMTQTVEDGHKISIVDENGEPDVMTDVRKFIAGVEYSDANGGPDFARRAAKFIALGYAVEVEAS